MTADLQRAFEANGFAPHSYSASVSRLVAAQKVRRVGDNLYCLSPLSLTSSAEKEAIRSAAS